MHGTDSGPLGPVRRIGVFRALVLGDMLCALPAMRALRARFPQARITLIGLPWAREWVQRQAELDDFIEFPGHPALPERSVDVQAATAFPARMQQERFDLLVQLHGSGGIVNEMLAQWGARHVAAFHEPHGFIPEPGLSCPWPERGTEIERLLRLTDVFGAPRPEQRLAFPLTAADRTQARALLESAGVSPGTRELVCVHPGAQLPSRRWPTARFAEIADGLCAQGRTVVLTGTPGEADLGQAIEGAMRHRPINLIGRTSLWTFGAVIEQAQLLVCNDTGASHVAAALGVRSVVISSGSDVSRWGPTDQERHRVLWAPRDCRPCAHANCPHEQSCAHDISAPMVWQAIERTHTLPISLQETHA